MRSTEESNCECRPVYFWNFSLFMNHNRRWTGFQIFGNILKNVRRIQYIRAVVARLSHFSGLIPVNTKFLNKVVPLKQEDCFSLDPENKSVPRFWESILGGQPFLEAHWSTITALSLYFYEDQIVYNMAKLLKMAKCHNKRGLKIQGDFQLNYP